MGFVQVENGKQRDKVTTSQRSLLKIYVETNGTSSKIFFSISAFYCHVCHRSLHVILC